MPRYAQNEVADMAHAIRVFHRYRNYKQLKVTIELDRDCFHDMYTSLCADWSGNADMPRITGDHPPMFEVYGLTFKMAVYGMAFKMADNV